MAVAVGVYIEEGTVVVPIAAEVYLNSSATKRGASIRNFNSKASAGVSTQRGTTKTGPMVGPYRPELTAILSMEV